MSISRLDSSPVGHQQSLCLAKVSGAIDSSSSWTVAPLIWRPRDGLAASQRLRSVTSPRDSTDHSCQASLLDFLSPRSRIRLKTSPGESTSGATPQ
ncbi:MAG: hypothetical protein FWH40_04775 [Coriobacteriia bacterium]|nr:hypothetical protein [Coriobacteriia bacterium]